MALAAGRGGTRAGVPSAAWYKLVPPFLVLFLLAAAINSAGFIPAGRNSALHFAAHFGITVAMAAVGMTSSLSAVRQAGWRPVALGGILWLLVSTSSLLLQRLTGQW